MTDIIEGDLIEAMARAMCTRPERIDPDAASMGQDGKIRPAVANRMIELRAALAAAAERGYVLTRAEPDAKMKKDAREVEILDSDGVWIALSEDEYAAIWRAMIAAGRVG